MFVVGSPFPFSYCSKLDVNDDGVGSSHDGEEGEEHFLDLCQFVSLLALPVLLDAVVEKRRRGRFNGSNAQDCFDKDNDDYDLVGWFETAFFAAAGSSNDHHDDNNNNVRPSKLDRRTLRRVFRSFGERGISNQVLDEMVEAGRVGTSPNEFSFAAALTGDLDLYDLDWKNQTTILIEDVLNLDAAHDDDPPPAADNNKGVEKFESEPDSSPEMAPRPKLDTLPRAFTAQFIDFVADTYNRPLYATLLWAAGVATYLSYIYQMSDKEGDDYWARYECPESMSSIGCSITKGIVAWLATMVQLSTLGLVFIVFGSAGNGIFYDRKYYFLIGFVVAMTTIVLTTIVPYFVGIDTRFFKTYGNKDEEYYYPTDYPTASSTDDDELVIEGVSDCGGDDGVLKYDAQRNVYVESYDYDPTTDYFAIAYCLSILLGCILLLSLVADTVLFAWRKKCSEFGKFIFTSAGRKRELSQKQSSFWKSSRMLHNAFQLHNGNGKSQNIGRTSSMQSSIHFEGVAKYQMKSVESEPVGGAFWTWKKIFDGSLFYEEGVWIHSRLLACNVAQVLVLVTLVFFMVLGLENAYKFQYSSSDSVPTQGNSILRSKMNMTMNCVDEWVQTLAGSATGTSEDAEASEADPLMGVGSSIGLSSRGASIPRSPIALQLLDADRVFIIADEDPAEVGFGNSSGLLWTLVGEGLRLGVLACINGTDMVRLSSRFTYTTLTILSYTMH